MSDAAVTPISVSDIVDLDELLTLVGVGDRRAFDRLYKLTAPRLLGLVKQVLRDPAQSEEVAQEIYLEVWQNSSRYDATRGRALSWMFTIAHRRAIDRVRASQASRDRDLRQGVKEHQIDHDSVAESVEITIESERIKIAMAGLTDLQRQALELSYFGGLSAAEVAERCAVPLSTAKTRMRDGLIRLRSLLEVPPGAAVA
jgi:RNA polymerase sigma-70 factor (ECF subfamily)